MKKSILFVLVFFAAGLTLFAQEPAFRLHMQAGKSQLAGDGDDYTTVVITARDGEGEVMTNINGTVLLRCSAGFLEESELKMTNGIAYVKYTAPIFGQPIKAAQRMVYFMVKFVRKFLARFNGSSDMASNQKLAGNIALETIREGTNPLTLIPQKNGDNNVYFVCEMNGVKGKTKIQIVKTTEGGNSSLMPGYYSGYDITGQAPFELMLESGGKGQMTQSGSEPMTILFTNEKSTEINTAMKKMMGGGEWMNAYMGASEKDMQYMEGYDVKKNGLPSIYLPMPNNGIFIYMPPILLEYQGRPKTPAAGASAASDEMKKQERVFVTLEQNELIGDGRSRTRAVFHYEDINGAPVSGKNIQWQIPKEFRIISVQNITDGSGNASAVIQAPVLRATEEKRGENTGGLIDNYDLFRLSVNYTSSENKNETTQTTLSVYKTLEKNLYILKPGFEPSPYKVLLPQLEFYNLQSAVSATVSEGLGAQKSKLPLNDAIVFLESDKFDREYFRRIYDTYFRKDRDMFITMLEKPEGGYAAFTGADGKFKLIVRDFEGKKRLYSGAYERTMPLEPLEARLADLTGRRTGALTEVLGLLSGGKNAAGTTDNSGTYSETMLNTLDYKTKVYSQIAQMEKVLCAGAFNEALGTEEKLHILGMLMTNAKGNARFMNDTGKELISNAWSLFMMAGEAANEYFKVSEKLGKKIGFDKVSDSLTKIGMKLDLGFWSKLTGTDRKTGTRRIVLDFIRKNVLSSDAPNKIKGSGAYYRAMGEAYKALSGFVFEQLTEGISDALSEANPVPDLMVEIMRARYYAGLRDQVDKLLAQPPARVHAVYEQLQPVLRDRSTEIRAYYQSIGSQRFNAEMYKADWDYFRESVVKGGVIAYDLLTPNWHNLKKHLEALETFNKVTDAAYTTTMLSLEIYRYHYLWCDARAAFDCANQSIDQGALVTAFLPEPSPEINFLNKAYAAGPPEKKGVPGIENLVGLDFSFNKGSFPVENINKAIAAVTAYHQWIMADSARRASFTGFEPQKAGAVYKAAYDFENQLSDLLLAAMAYAEDKSASRLREYEKAASALEISAASLAENSAIANARMDQIPSKITIPLSDFDEKDSSQFWRNPLYQKLGAGVLGLALVTVMVLWIVRRRSPRVVPAASALPQSKAPSPQRSAVASAPDNPASPPPPSASPRFCPQCGSAFKPGAKFCGKCGYKPM